MARTWYCENCHKSINSYGLAMHRKMHRKRKEFVKFRVWSGLNIEIWTYDYREAPDHMNGSE